MGLGAARARAGVKTRHARQIRSGILLARQVARRERVGPRGLTPVGRGHRLPPWEQAYHRELARLARPPAGDSGGW